MIKTSTFSEKRASVQGVVGLPLNAQGKSAGSCDRAIPSHHNAKKDKDACSQWQMISRTHPDALGPTRLVDVDDRDCLLDVRQDQVHVVVVSLMNPTIRQRKRPAGRKERAQGPTS